MREGLTAGTWLMFLRNRKGSSRAGGDELEARVGGHDVRNTKVGRRQDHKGPCSHTL